MRLRLTFLLFLLTSPALLSAAVSGNQPTEKEEEILDHPSRDVEQYDLVRKKFIHFSSQPDWSVSFAVTPLAFRSSEFRAPKAIGPRVNFVGFHLSGERIFTKNIGLLSAGGEISFFGNAPAERNFFARLFPFAMISGGPYLAYQFTYFRKQWVSPIIRGGLDFFHHDYVYAGNRISGSHEVARIDVGLLIFLNIIEPDAAGQMMSNWNIKRTYLAGFFTIARDLKPADFDLSERNFKIGFRFEF